MHKDIIIIGSGFSGIGAAILLHQKGYDLMILERENDLGGTWRDNKYPGIAVDISSFTYSYSFEQNPSWSRVFAPGKELHNYAHNCSNKYGIAHLFRYNSEIIEAKWEENDAIWTVTLSDNTIYTCNILISATGALTDPKMPDIGGWESYKGEKIHTARWDNAIDLKDKNVGIIGTGATAVQLAPAIAPVVKKLEIFQRTPIWIFPKPDAVIPLPVQNIFRSIPFVQNNIRNITDFFTEKVMVTAVIEYKEKPYLVKSLEQFCKAYLATQVRDKNTRELLTPKYGFGCKRPSFSSNYYAMFNRDNVSLVTSSIASIYENGIITNDGKKHPLDVIIAATGFHVMKDGNYLNYKLLGRNNKEIGEYWNANRQHAYHGCSLPDFPNFFIIFGPYSASGLSWFDMIEIQMNHILRVLDQKKLKKANIVAVKEDANKRYFEYILKKQKSSVFLNNNCANSNSYYFDKHGDAPFLRPMSVSASRKYSLESDLNDYTYS